MGPCTRGSAGKKSQKKAPTLTSTSQSAYLRKISRKIIMRSKRKTPKASSDSSAPAGDEHPFAAAAQWNLEQDYEQKPRAMKKRKAEKESTRLPIKTPNGLLKQTLIPEPVSESDREDEGNEDGGEWVGVAEEPAEEEARPRVSERQRIVDAKEELASIATNLNEDPEENVSLAVGRGGIVSYKVELGWAAPEAT